RGCRQSPTPQRKSAPTSEASFNPILHAIRRGRQVFTSNGPTFWLPCWFLSREQPSMRQRPAGLRRGALAESSAGRQDFIDVSWNCHVGQFGPAHRSQGPIEASPIQSEGT